MSTSPNYTIISADTHAGGSHEQYREFLDPAWRDEFDAWREKYKNPWKDLRNTDLRVRNWDDERRDADQLADGVVGEVLFPNTVPPFYPAFVLFAGPPKEEDYERRRAGIHAHNRWMDDFCAPAARAARRHRPDLPERHRRRDRGRHLDQGARPARRRAPPDDPAGREVGAPALRPRVRPAVGGAAGPRHPRAPARRHRLARLRPARGDADDHDRRDPLLRHPQLRAHAARAACSSASPGSSSSSPSPASRSSRRCSSSSTASSPASRKGSIGELKYAEGTALPKSATEYFQQNVWVGASFPTTGRPRGAHAHPGGPPHVGQRLPPRRGHAAVHP